MKIVIMVALIAFASIGVESTGYAMGGVVQRVALIKRPLVMMNEALAKFEGIIEMPVLRQLNAKITDRLNHLRLVAGTPVHPAVPDSHPLILYLKDRATSAVIVEGEIGDEKTIDLLYEFTDKLYNYKNTIYRELLVTTTQKEQRKLISQMDEIDNIMSKAEQWIEQIQLAP